jgi:hypothetical protein
MALDDADLRHDAPRVDVVLRIIVFSGQMQKRTEARVRRVR